MRVGTEGSTYQGISVRRGGAENDLSSVPHLHTDDIRRAPRGTMMELRVPCASHGAGQGVVLGQWVAGTHQDL